MENTEVFGSSTAPLTWHDFLERMRQPSAADFVKSIKSFIVSFMNNAPDPERDSASVQEFLNNMEAAFRAHPLWAGRSQEELDSAGEGLEKYIMTKLFSRVFASHPDDVKIDDQLYEKMSLVQQFIRPENLDILPTYQNETSWLLAQKELQKINMYKAPRDKLVCILSCCKVISNLLLNASITSNENPPGADEFLPVLIYVTIKANPSQLHSNLLYIQRYRRESRLVGEAAYYFTNMLSAESFILNIDGKALSMDEAEFNNNMVSAQALISGLSAQYSDTQSQNDRNSAEHIPRTESIEPRHSTSNSTRLSTQSSESTRNEAPPVKDDVSLNKIPSISDLENKGATMLLAEEKVNQIFLKFPYLYCKSGDLTVGEVDDLLNNYKQLVFKYVSLAKAIGVGISPPGMPVAQSQIKIRDETVEKFEDTKNNAEEDDGRTEGIEGGSNPIEGFTEDAESKPGHETQSHEEMNENLYR